MKEFKARIVAETDYEPVIYIANNWRSFGCPFQEGIFRAYKTIKGAKAAAERMAKTLGIKLKWEEK